MKLQELITDLKAAGANDNTLHLALNCYELGKADAQRKPVTDEQSEALIEDLAEWSRHVEVDTAHESLEKHVRRVLAAHGIKGPA